MGFFDFLFPDITRDVSKIMKKAAQERKVAHFREAIRQYDRVIKIEPRNDTAYVGKGGCLIGRGKFKEALEALDKAIKINPKNADAWHSKGIALKNLGSKEEGERLILKAEKIAEEIKNS